MTERLELERNRDFGDILNDTFVLIKQNFLPLVKSYLAICGVFIVTTIALSIVAYAQRVTMEPQMYILSGYYWMQVGISYVNYAAMLLTITAYFAVYKQKGNQPATVAEVWGFFRYYFFRFMSITFVTAIITVVGFLFCLLPGIYFGVIFSMIAPVMVFENGSFDYTFSRVFKIIKGNWWSTFGILIIMTILVILGMLVIMLPAMILTGTSAWLTGKDLEGPIGMVYAIFKGLGQIFYIVPSIGVVLTYFDLTEQKEANSLAGRIQAFGQTSSADSPDHSSEQY